MKISSNFNDYYDIMQQYGKDDKLIFMRINNHGVNFDSNQWKLDGLENELKNKALNEKLKNGNFNSFFGEQKIMNDLIWKINGSQKSNINPKYKIAEVIAVVNGIPFNSYMLLEWMTTENKNSENLQEYAKYNGYKIKVRNISSEECFKFIKDHINEFNDSYVIKSIKTTKNFEEYKDILDNKKYFNYFNFKYGSQNDITKEMLLKIHEELKAPIYFIVDNKILSNIPLNYLGMTNLFEGNVEQLYQEISYCLGNLILNKNEPPTEISNEMKIQQYGFDKKISFRKRV